jgi:hypothetical protein
MTAREISTLVTAWKTGKALAARPGKALQKPLQPFEPSVNVKNAKLPDAGKLNFPKIFRRQATFWAEVPGPLPETTIRSTPDQGRQRQRRQGIPAELFPGQHQQARPQKTHQVSK